MIEEDGLLMSVPSCGPPIRFREFDVDASDNIGS
jgi:hypothetical protein